MKKEGPVTGQKIREFVSKASDKQLAFLVDALNMGHYLATAEEVDHDPAFENCALDMWWALEREAEKVGVSIEDKER